MRFLALRRRDKADNECVMRFYPANVSILPLCLAANLLSLISVHGATNLISGQVTTNSTWSGTNLLQGTVTIQSNITVQISAGTRMLMNTGATLVVNGQLLADGTSNQPIAFTRATTSARWARMMFVRAADSRLRNCVIEYANSAGDHQDYYP